MSESGRRKIAIPVVKESGEKRHRWVAMPTHSFWSPPAPSPPPPPARLLARRQGVNGTQHDAAGNPVINKKKFPAMAGLVTYGHSKNVRMGWYQNGCACGERAANFDPAFDRFSRITHPFAPMDPTRCQQRRATCSNACLSEAGRCV